MASKESNVVLNFKMDGQVEYAKTIRDINSIMNAAASEYKTHIAAMGKDAEQTSKLAAEKKKLEIQMEAAKKRTEMLRNEYEAMAKSSKTTTGQLAAKHNQLMNSERAEIALGQALERVNDGLSDQAEESRLVQEQMNLLETQSGRLETQTEKLNAEYELQKVQLGDNADEGEKLALKMAHLNDVHEVATDKVENLEQQLDLAKQQYGENSSEVDRYEIQLLEARTAEQQLANQIDLTNKKLNEQVSRLEKTSQKIQDLGKKLKDLGSDMSDIGKEMSLKITAPVVALTGSLVKTGIEYKAFKEEARQAFTVLLGSAEAAEEHMERIMAFAKTTPFAFPDLVSANRKLVSFGMAAESTEPVMEAIANAVAAMGGGAQEIDTLSDVFAKIHSGGKITGEELNRFSDQGINALAILANQADVSMDEMRKQISSGSIDSEKAISQLVDGIMNGTDGVAGQTAKLGGSLEALEGTWKGAIDSMKGAWRRAGDAIVSDDMFTKMTEAVGKLTQVINKLPEIIGPIADTLGNFLISFIDHISAIVDWFLALDPVMQQFAVKIGLVLVAAGPFLLLLGQIISIGGTIISTIGTLMGSLSGLSSVFTLLTGPVGLIIAAVAALIAVFVALYQNNEEFREKVLEIWEQIQEGFSIALGFIQELVTTIMTAVTEFFSEQISKIRDFWDENGAVIMELFSLYFGMIWEVIQAHLGWIRGLWEAIWPILSNVVKIAWKTIGMFVENGISLVLGIVQTILKLLQGDWEGAWETIKGTAETIMNNIIDFFKSIDLLQTGKDIINGLIKGIGSMVGSVGTAVKNIATNIYDTFTGFFKIKSPARKMIGPGKNITEGAAIGIEDGANEAVQATEGVAQSIYDAFDLDFPDFDPPRPRQPQTFGGTTSNTSPSSFASNIGENIKESLQGLAGDIAVHVYLDTKQLNTELAPGMSQQLNQMNKMKARSNGVVIV